ncbi:periplasmic binding protein domain-containing protein [Purpureocillium lavendulum]|uniref:Periplasmic binding protein domain-containing protein n=1 Tax=Purpureocillium lavendulum TaxID=1247861 RepID=A0AB34FRE5_9HYPO|nr:periplasmic binding protein domain-containing protein [Purpureocillium lavendulum]
MRHLSLPRIAWLAPLVIAGAAALSSRDTAECASGLYILYARGTGEPQDTGMTHNISVEIAKRIPGSKVVPVVYPATFTSPPYQDSVDDGVTHMQAGIQKYAKDCPNGKIALLGYSQGAHVTMDSVCGGSGGVFDKAPPLPQTLVTRSSDTFCDSGDIPSVHTSYIKLYGDGVIKYVVDRYHSAVNNNGTTSTSLLGSAADLAVVRGHAGIRHHEAAATPDVAHMETVYIVGAGATSHVAYITMVLYIGAGASSHFKDLRGFAADSTHVTDRANLANVSHGANRANRANSADCDHVGDISKLDDISIVGNLRIISCAASPSHVAVHAVYANIILFYSVIVFHLYIASNILHEFGIVIIFYELVLIYIFDVVFNIVFDVFFNFFADNPIYVVFSFNHFHSRNSPPNIADDAIHAIIYVFHVFDILHIFDFLYDLNIVYNFIVLDVIDHFDILDVVCNFVVLDILNVLDIVHNFVILDIFDIVYILDVFYILHFIHFLHIINDFVVSNLDIIHRVLLNYHDDYVNDEHHSDHVCSTAISTLPADRPDKGFIIRVRVTPGRAGHRQMSTIQIGALAPLSRPGWIDAGRHLLAGLELAVAEVNNAGGISGGLLELLVRDTAGDATMAAAAVDELASLGVVALAGEYHSVVARAVAARADAIGLPYLCSSAVLDNLTEQPTDWVARLAPPQSRGWCVFSDYLISAGHTSIGIIADPTSVYWASGTRILREHVASRGGTAIEFNVRDATPTAICDELAARDHRPTALVLLLSQPSSAAELVRAVRRDDRLTGVAFCAPAGQPELADWVASLGIENCSAMPFLRYLPGQLSPLGARVEDALRERLAETPSFVAFEGYDTIIVLADMLRAHNTHRMTSPPPWSDVAVQGTRGHIAFSRASGVNIWQWTWPPIQVAERNPSQRNHFRVLHTA